MLEYKYKSSLALCNKACQRPGGYSCQERVALDVNSAHFLQIMVVASDPRYNLFHLFMRLSQIDGQGSSRSAVVDDLDSDDAVCVVCFCDGFVVGAVAEEGDDGPCADGKELLECMGGWLTHRKALQQQDAKSRAACQR